MTKSVIFLLILFGLLCIKLVGKTRPMYIDLKVQVLNDKKEPLSNQMVLVILGHRLPTDTIYTDINGYFNYKYGHANPYCATNISRGIKNVLYRRKKIRINFIINSKEISVKVKHKKFDYYYEEKPKNTFKKVIQI